MTSAGAKAAEEILCCPVCQQDFTQSGQALRCLGGHVFDMAREGYVNLLLPQYRRSKDPGYNKEMIAGRRDFFDAGHYERLADGVARLIADHLSDLPCPVVVDAGCGEGYYLRRLRTLLEADGRTALLCGMDISKHGVRVAAKRDREGVYAVAGTFRMPVLPAAVDLLLTHFSPVSGEDFKKVVKPGGIVVVGGPGEDHLFSFKELLYDAPAHHTPADTLSESDGFEPVGITRIRYDLRLEGPGQVANLLLMTPFFWSVGEEARARLSAMDRLDTTVDVVMRSYRRLPDAPVRESAVEAGVAEVAV